jgi:ATP-binding cassette subfamily B protein
MGMRNFRALTKDRVSVKDLDRQTLKRAWKFTRQFRGKIAFYLVMLLLASLIGSLTPLVLKNIINLAIPHKSVRLLVLYTAEIAVLTFGQSALGVLNRFLGSTIGEGIIYKLRLELFSHMQMLSQNFFTNSQTGAIISRLNSDVVSSQAVVSTMGSVVSDLSSLAFAFFFMFRLSPTVTLLTLLVIPIIFLIDRLLGKRLARVARAQMQANAEMSAYGQERFNVSGALLVALFGNRKLETETFAGKAAEVKNAGVRFALYGRLYFTTLSLLGGIGTVLVYAIGGSEAIHATLSIGALVALASYITQIFSPLTDLSGARVNLLQALVSFDRVFEVLDLEPAVASPENPVPLPTTRGEIHLIGVSFKYPTGAPLASLAKEGAQSAGIEREWALREVTFDVLPGETVALVGPSGAGKTTITTLITRLYDPTEGRITLDGIDLRELDLDQLRSHIGVVTQDPFLFHDTVRNNLRYANIYASDTEIEKAVEASQLTDLISRLPNGLDTLVGERGYRLSGGEKQRLAIARVLIKNPSIVILDEATSSLDATNEALIQLAISEILKDRTSIVIAHRLSTILGADKIVVMDHGRVAEIGNHASLIARHGIYSELFHRQFVAADQVADNS